MLASPLIPDPPMPMKWTRRLRKRLAEKRRLGWGSGEPADAPGDGPWAARDSVRGSRSAFSIPSRIVHLDRGFGRPPGAAAGQVFCAAKSAEAAAPAGHHGL